MALRLKRRGINRVRPLLGGYEAWVARGYPVDPVVASLVGSPGVAVEPQVAGN